MPRRVLNVSEARRDLPRLVKQVATGGSALAIGPRGKPVAVLVGAEEYLALRRRARTVTGAPWDLLRLELVGGDADLVADLRRIREETTLALDRRAAPRRSRPR